MPFNIQAIDVIWRRVVTYANDAPNQHLMTRDVTIIHKQLTFIDGDRQTYGSISRP